MENFTKIMIAIDISPEADQIMNKAMDMAEKYSAEVSLVHVVQPIIIETGYEMIPILTADIEDNLVKRAETHLVELAKKYKIEEKNTLVLMGAVKSELHREARERDIDLIIIGTHARHGVSLILGSTANAVMHGTPCDVLCVKV